MIIKSDLNTIIVASDSFKGSLSSREVGQAVAEAVASEMPEMRCITVPIADGGEGTVEAIIESLGGEYISTTVNGPMGQPLNSKYGIYQDMAIIEVAAASGLTLIPEHSRNPMTATSYGTGQLILDALKRGCRKFFIGVGGSATNDAGVGMLQALGYIFLDKDQHPVSTGGKEVGKIVSIDDSKVIPALKEASFTVACDVSSPLCGPQGASVVFGPQKGATSEMVNILDKGLKSFAKVTSQHLGIDYSAYPGAGAAGGIGFALLSFLKAKLCPGVEMVLDAIGFDELLDQAALVFTGEGQLDNQTSLGKVPMGVLKKTSKKGVPVIAIAGSIIPQAVKSLEEIGFNAIFPIVPGPMDLKEAMKPDMAYENINRTVRQILKTLRIP